MNAIVNLFPKRVNQILVCLIVSFASLTSVLPGPVLWMRILTQASIGKRNLLPADEGQAFRASGQLLRFRSEAE